VRPIFYDTETTGVRSEKDRIIEIAAYDPEQNRTFEMLVNPLCLIPQEATAIHNITNEMVKDALPFSEVGKKFSEFCDGDVVLIAHNNDGFDYHFLKAEFGRNQLEMPVWKYFDTLKWARRYLKHLPRHTLQFLREFYQITANTAHRALDDVVILHQVYTYMTGDLGIKQCYELLNVPRTLQHMPFGKYQGKPLKEVPADYIKWMHQNGAFDKPENGELKAAFIQLNLLTS
jgi:DNA polymerase-3 subunit epsilon